MKKMRSMVSVWYNDFMSYANDMEVEDYMVEDAAEIKAFILNGFGMKPYAEAATAGTYSASK